MHYNIINYGCVRYNPIAMRKTAEWLVPRPCVVSKKTKKKRKVSENRVPAAPPSSVFESCDLVV